MPTYNRCEYLDRTLASYVNQTQRDFEIVLLDDGSGDATPAVAAKYEGRLRINYRRQENQGEPAPAARPCGPRPARFWCSQTMIGS